LVVFFGKGQGPKQERRHRKDSTPFPVSPHLCPFTFSTMPPYSLAVCPCPSYVDVAHLDRHSENEKVALNHSPVVRYPLTPIPECFVRFQCSEEIHEIPNKEQCLQQGNDDIWYNKSEFTRIQQENRRLLRGYHRKTIQSSSKDFCLRGLERQTSGGAKRVLTNRLTCLYVVLEEQSRQYQLGINDPEMLGNLASSTTSHCQKEAIMLGFDDAGYDYEMETTQHGGEDFVCHILFNPSKWFAPSTSKRSYIST
jgi:hypothetical protein